MNTRGKLPARRLGRRSVLGLGAVTGAVLSFPHVWVPRPALAQSSGRGAVKHLIYIRLSGGFRFPTAFNGDVDSQFNPFGLAGGAPSGVSWGVSRLLEGGEYLNQEAAEGEEAPRIALRSAHELADRITVMPTVDHEPLAARADGNHETGLERFLTGFVGGDAGIFTRIQMGLRARYEEALLAGEVVLPSFVMGSSGMARGLGEFSPYRPPVLGGASFDQFVAVGEGPPEWSSAFVSETDRRMRDRQHPRLREAVDAYLRTREATEAYSEIFSSQALKVDEESDEMIDGVSNSELRALFGNSGESRSLRLALRLFHYGSPAVYLDQGGYDYHSDEEGNLPDAMQNVARMISALIAVLPTMSHPAGGTYWDHTLVAIGSEFSRTANGSRFNSARGSDHSGDNATRWMSMPFFGGAVRGGRIVGASTRRDDLGAEGKVFSYRSVMNTLMDGLGCEPDAFFPGDPVVPDLLGG